MQYKVSIFLRYTFFCIIAITINLLIQRFFIYSLDLSNAYFFALVFGTIGGLVSKYFLDKKYIFLDMDHSYINNRNKFFLYSLNGILTTIIFWSSESLFYFLFQSHFAREIGAILGLTVGYILKYRLDKKFVFKLGMEA